MTLLSGPIVLTSANRSGEPPAQTAGGVIEAIGDDAAVVIDGGPSRYGQASTVVRINGNGWQVLRVGVVSEEALRRHAACLIVFVCTGNTCRSPLAEVLCKKLLAARIGCTVAELPERGFIVLSAGLAAMMGGATEEAIEVAREMGADLSTHRSRSLTADLLAQADYAITMTRGHLLALADHAARLGVQPRQLCPDGEDVQDPVGADQKVYRDCAQQIQRHLEKWVAEIPLE
jgi:protein-tyrosine phosphatase